MKILIGAAVFTISAFAQSSPQLAVVSAADYSSTVAPGSIVTIFAANIATSTTQAPAGALPVTLGNVSATVTDAGGATAPIALMLVSPAQINGLLPTTLQSGSATITVQTAAGVALKGKATIAQVAPSIFTADQSGEWLAAAQVVVAHPNGSQTLVSPIANCGSALLATAIKSYFSPCAPMSIDIGTSLDQAVLILYGTGIRNAISLIAAKCPKCGYSPVTVSVCNACGSGPANLAVSYVGPQGAGNMSNGLDQINVLLPNWLAGSGLVSFNITATDIEPNLTTGSDANTVYAYIR